jgi:cation diffusion facilitator family transporter
MALRGVFNLTGKGWAGLPELLGAGGADARSVTVIAALAGDLSIAVLKFYAAASTGSAAMYAEGIHSLIDATTELILLYSVFAARRPSNALHQFGYGREAFFWSFIAALLILAAGAGTTIHDGLLQIAAPTPIKDARLNYAILFASLCVEIVSSAFTLRKISDKKGWRGLIVFARTSRDTASLTVLFGSLTGVLGLLLAAAGIVSGELLDRPWLDGLASIGIGAILGVSALVLAGQAKALLIGLSASPAKVRTILDTAIEEPGIEAVNGAITVHIGVDQLLVALSVEFEPDLKALEIEDVANRMEQRMKAAHPDVLTVFLKPQSPQRFAEVQAARGW